MKHHIFSILKMSNSLRLLSSYGVILFFLEQVIEIFGGRPTPLPPPQPPPPRAHTRVRSLVKKEKRQRLYETSHTWGTYGILSVTMDK